MPFVATLLFDALTKADKDRAKILNGEDIWAFEGQEYQARKSTVAIYGRIVMGVL
jgi:hypothetical protein